jgi:CheY-like chemotaxis protein
VAIINALAALILSLFDTILMISNRLSREFSRVLLLNHFNMNRLAIRIFFSLLAASVLALELHSQMPSGSPEGAAANRGRLLTDVLLILAAVITAAWFIQKILSSKENNNPQQNEESHQLLVQRLDELRTREAELQRENIRLDLLNKNLVDEMAERENIAQGGNLDADRIYSMLSDEWRSSLNIIQGMSRALKESPLTQEQLQLLINLEQATAYLNSSVLKALDVVGDAEESALEQELAKKLAFSAGTAAGRPRNLDGTRILVVEDNPLNQLVVVNILKRAGAMVSTANHGLEALGLYDSQNFDLILMDIQMPQMDGYRATAEIRTHPDLSKRNVPIIALTASAFLTRKEKAELFGMNDHVAKPFEPDELLAKISNCLEV